ncbi:hypothetical protein E1211_05125 [Micromonospora sp. 15K316]|uniref:hypothetical protein n=1 Tax=Micromonospora sp. 15K316 TaxID=2530376 RepID=UPI00104EEAFE|nr:hypothetical protein [Micromonospora sp. 15K316]TDC39051.1 hypothetical protein E1211_05125 [Micromonospora sp. 15K316]
MAPYRAGGTLPKVFPSLPLALLLPCSLIAVMGVTDDRRPPPPMGVLVPAVVVGEEPARAGQEAYVVVRAETADGPVLCSIGRRSFVDGRLPAPHQRLTVDHTPNGCLPEPVNTELPRGVIVTMGAGGLVLSLCWLWAGSRFGPLGRPRRARG